MTYLVQLCESLLCLTLRYSLSTNHWPITLCPPNSLSFQRPLNARIRLKWSSPTPESASSKLILLCPLLNFLTTIPLQISSVKTDKGILSITGLCFNRTQNYADLLAHLTLIHAKMVIPNSRTDSLSIAQWPTKLCSPSSLSFEGPLTGHNKSKW